MNTTYSHDGLRDALTQLAAPTLLYEELRREIARARRESRDLSLVRFVLTPVDVTASDFVEEIIAFAHDLTIFSRDEDICARMGEREFVCVLRGSEDAVGNYVHRIASSWRQTYESKDLATSDHCLKLCFSSLSSTVEENVLTLLNRLDSQPLLLCP